ncbi:MAG TPA: hypothetical protein P5527_05165 [Kiritimatiellia bacterium]|nr:hypothetical protein [Kiritimatiellia bacterium]
MKIITVVLGLALLVGCASPQVGLIQFDMAQILRVAEREIATKCPEFKMNEFEPRWVDYRARVNPQAEGTIGISYISREPTGVKDWCSITGGPPCIARTHRSASFVLTVQGELEKQDVSEWREFQEWTYVRYSEVTIVEPKEEKPSNKGKE